MVDSRSTFISPSNARPSRSHRTTWNDLLSSSTHCCAIGEFSNSMNTRCGSCNNETLPASERSDVGVVTSRQLGRQCPCGNLQPGRLLELVLPRLHQYSDLAWSLARQSSPLVVSAGWISVQLAPAFADR